MDIKVIDVKSRTFKNETVFGEVVELGTALDGIYQNSPSFKSMKMENCAPGINNEYGAVGCRAVGLYRVSKNLFDKTAPMLYAPSPCPKFLTPREFDDMLDEGGENNDAWVDNNSSPVYDIINPEEYVKRLNKKYWPRSVDCKPRIGDCGFYYHYIKIIPSAHKQDDTIITFGDHVNGTIEESLLKQHHGVVKLPSLVNRNGSHFVNFSGYIKAEDGTIYLKLVETYTGYNGYQDKYVKYDDAEYLEFIVLS